MVFKTSYNSALGVPVIGQVDATELYPIGTVIKGFDETQGEGEFIYLPGAANVAEGSCVVYDLLPSAPAIALADTDTAAQLHSGRPIAWAMGAIVADKFGWFQISGLVKAAGIAGGAAGIAHLTATAGAVDDTDIAGGQIAGAYISSAIDTPSAGFILSGATFKRVAPFAFS